eukprot:Skav210846  [mRNA]  locus=scaffold2829:25669:27201:- [translate_table: standard]
MSFTDAQREQILAKYVQELLAQDQSKQQVTLENLSRYAEASPEASPITKRPAAAAASALAPAAMAVRTEDAKPMKVELSPGAQQRKESGAASSRLQHATQVLQAALTNWEACMQGESQAQSQRAQSSTEMAMPEMAMPGFVPPIPPPGLKGRTQVDEYANTLDKIEKALSHFNNSANNEEKTLAFLEMLAKEEANKMASQERLKMMTLMQTRNQSNMDKLYNMLKEPKAAAMPAPAMPAPAMPAPAVPAGGIDNGTVQLAMALKQMEQLTQLQQLGQLQMQQHLGHGGAAMLSPPWAPYTAPVAPMTPMAPMAPMAPAPVNYQAPGPAPTWWPGEKLQGKGGAPRKGGGPKKRNPDGPVSAGPHDSHSGDTLRMHLRSLLQVDSSRVLIVRKINRLGFASPTVLREHFSWYGTVENVLVAHSRVKSGGGQAGIVSRLRPSGLGFVVMSKGEEAEKILAEGSEQQVSSTIIRVQRFERRMSESPGGLEELEEKEEEMQEQEPCTESRAMGG